MLQWNTGRPINVLTALLAGCALGAVTACSPWNVHSDTNAGANIAQCHQFAWARDDEADTASTRVPPDDSARAFANPVNDSRLRAAIEAQLRSHGLRPAADASTADCRVHYFMGNPAAGEPTQKRRWRLGLGVGVGGGSGFGSVGFNNAAYGAQPGRIVVDLASASHQPIWHAWVNADMTGLTGDQAQQKIDAAVSALFDKFPK